MSIVQRTPSTDSALGAFSTAPIAKKAQPPPANTDDAAGSLPSSPFALTLAVAFAAMACQLILTSPSPSKFSVSIALPDFMHLAVLAAYIAFANCISLGGLFSLVWLAHGKRRLSGTGSRILDALWTTKAMDAKMARLLDAVCIVYGACMLVIPFALPLATGGHANMSIALVLWVQYWKALDIIGGTAPQAVLEHPLNLFCHFAFLVEYKCSKDGVPQESPIFTRRATAAEAAAAAASSWPMLVPPPKGALLASLKEVVLTAILFSAVASALSNT